MNYEKPKLVSFADATGVIRSSSANKVQVVADGTPIGAHPATSNAYEADE